MGSTMNMMVLPPGNRASIRYETEIETAGNTYMRGGRSHVQEYVTRDGGPSSR